MAIPTYEGIMFPLLKKIADGKEHRLRDLVEELGDEFELTEVEKMEMQPSGADFKFRNRVGWARTGLKKAGLLIYPSRGYALITAEGKKVIAEVKEKIDNKYLMRYNSYREYFRPTKKNEKSDSEKDEIIQLPDTTPDELMENTYQTLRRQLAEELLEMVKNNTWQFFEQLVVDLLIKMGYGGTRKDAGQAIGGSGGDEGIDGIIKEDRLGLDTVYIQAKRWDNTVGRPEIQKFAGALQGKKAKKGIFITTSGFTKGAREYVSIIDLRIVLIDGEALAQLMLDYKLGVYAKASYEILKIDSDYFEE